MKSKRMSSRKKKAMRRKEAKEGVLDETKFVKRVDGAWVSRAKQELGNANPWTQALAQAKAELGLSGFVVPSKGTALHTRATELSAAIRGKKTSKKRSNRMV